MHFDSYKTFFILIATILLLIIADMCYSPPPPPFLGFLKDAYTPNYPRIILENILSLIIIPGGLAFIIAGIYWLIKKERAFVFTYNCILILVVLLYGSSVIVQYKYNIVL